MKTKLVILATILIGLLLRVLFFNSSPSSLYGDELTIILDANSLLNSGHDQLGNFLPLTFPMGAGRPAGYVYFSIPFIAIFGPTALGVRALSILSGLGIILLTYYLCRKLFSEKVGLFAALVTAVSPWDISLSRGGFEAHFALFLALLGVYLFIKAKEKPKFYILSAISFGLTLHTYPTYKLSLLLFLPLLFWFEQAQINLGSKKYFISGVIVLFILGIISLDQTFIGGSETRFSNINIFNQEKLKNSIEEKINLERTITQLPISFAKYFHNKPVEYIKVLGENYLQNFSADFLFIHGDRNPRHNMATIGEMYVADAILIFVGFLSFWSRQKRKILFLLFWLILAPIPTAIIDLPHALRSSFMLPPLILLSALGLMSILSLKNRLITCIIAVIFIVQFINFAQKLYFLAPAEYSNFWSYPARLASETALENRDNFKYIILSDKIDNMEFAYPVYAKINPNQVIEQNKQKSKLVNYEVKKFDNVYIAFLPGDEIFKLASNLEGSILYLTTVSDVKDFKDRNYQILSGLDGKGAILLFKNK